MSKYSCSKNEIEKGQSKQINSLHPFCFSESGSDYSKGEEEEEFDELDHREEGQFWATNDEPVERAESPAYDPESEDERPTPEPVISLFAIGKLSR